MGWKDGLAARVHTALAEDWSTVPRIITTTCRFSSWRVCTCVRACVHVVLMPLAFVTTCIYAHIPTQLKKIKNVKKQNSPITREACLYGGTSSDAPWSLMLC